MLVPYLSPFLPSPLSLGRSWSRVCVQPSPGLCVDLARPHCAAPSLAGGSAQCPSLVTPIPGLCKQWRERRLDYRHITLPSTPSHCPGFAPPHLLLPPRVAGLLLSIIATMCGDLQVVLCGGGIPMLTRWVGFSHQISGHFRFCVSW